MSKILPWDNVIVNIAQTFPKRIVMKISSIYTIFNFPVLTLVKAHFFQCFQIWKPLVTIGTTCWLPDYRKSSLLRRGFLTMHILHPRGKTPKKGLLEYDDPVLKNGIFEGYILRPRTWIYGPNKWKFRRVPVLKCLLTYDIDDDIWQDDGKILRLWHSPKKKFYLKIKTIFRSNLPFEDDVEEFSVGVKLKASCHQSKRPLAWKTFKILSTTIKLSDHA